MIDFKEFLEDLIQVNSSRNSTGIPMTRKEYYNRYLPDSDPVNFYLQLRQCETFNIE